MSRVRVGELLAVVTAGLCASLCTGALELARATQGGVFAWVVALGAGVVGGLAAAVGGLRAVLWVPWAAAAVVACGGAGFYSGVLAAAVAVAADVKSRLPYVRGLCGFVAAASAGGFLKGGRGVAIALFAACVLDAWMRAEGRPPATRKGRKRRGNGAWAQLPRAVQAVFVCVAAALFAGGVIEPGAARLRPRAMPRGYRVLAQAEGVTGLVSVVQGTSGAAGSKSFGYRFLTCDHSVLGGAYTDPGYESETIFGQFHVHEAVRLTRLPGEPADAVGGREGRALCIGMGVGVVADALHALGCDVDVVEIDAAVARFARDYFRMGVPPQRVHVQDAVVYLADAQQRVATGDMARYDYVIHDVFTGGAVPLAVFSPATFFAIRNVMTPTGVLAVNFVGALDTPPTTRATRAVAAIHARLSAAFNHVTAFTDENNSSTMHNIVFFASNTATRLEFRAPVERDFLGSGIRRDTLRAFPAQRLGAGALGRRMAASDATDWRIDAGQWVTARAHWRMMRSQFPRTLWDGLARRRDERHRAWWSARWSGAVRKKRV